MYCNNDFSGKYWAIFDPELFGPPDNPDEQDPDYRGTIVYMKNVQCTLLDLSAVDHRIQVAARKSSIV
jgi:hypothetical protein